MMRLWILKPKHNFSITYEFDLSACYAQADAEIAEK